MSYPELRDSVSREFGALRRAPDLEAICKAAEPELHVIRSLVRAPSTADPFKQLQERLPVFTARAVLQQALLALDNDLVRPVARNRNPFPPLMGAYFNIPPEEDERFPFARDNVASVISSEVIQSALDVLARYCDFVPQALPPADQWERLRYDLLRQGLGIDPERWVITTYGEVAATVALDYLMGHCRNATLNEQARTRRN